MRKALKFSAALFVAAALFVMACCAADVSSSLATSNDLVVRASNNTGVACDIKGYPTGSNIYLFLPADVNIAQLYVTFGNETKILDMTSPKTVALRNGEFTLSVMQTDLPVLYMQIDESKGSIAAMNRDPNHKAKCYGSFYLDVPTALAQQKGWQDYYADLSSEIKGRGNATWGLDKKAYQIKLDKKQSILEMGKDKTWIILANYGDRSLIRNKLAYDFAKDIGINYALDSEFVDVFFNGVYQGNYLLTEKVEIGKERVNIYDLEEPDENPDADRVTGGYLIEYDRLARGEKTWLTGPMSNMLISVKSPEEANDAQKQYITNFVSNMESAIYASDGMSPEGKYYSDYMDVDSFIKLYWVNEVFKNGDYFYGSTFMYKDVGDDQKLYSGPAWDYDITLANACSNAGASTPARQANLATPVGWWARNVADGFAKELFRHEDFLKRNKELYDQVVREPLMALSSRAEEYAQYIAKSAQMNFVRWDVLKQDHIWETPNKAATYRGELDFVENFLSERAAWIDEIMNSEMGISNLGSQDNPIKVSSVQDLKKLSDEVNAGNDYMDYYFLQTADIDFAGEEFMPIGVTGNGFAGSYDGGGYAIKNINISTASVNDTTKPCGLFANVSGGMICNVNIESGSVKAVAHEVGAIAGRMNGAVLYNCTNRAAVSNLATSNSQVAGGLVGQMVNGSPSYVLNSINYGDVSVPSVAAGTCWGVGGLVGHIASGTISGCVNLGRVTDIDSDNAPVGGIVGGYSGRITRVYRSYWLTGENGIEAGQGVSRGSNNSRNVNSFSGQGITAEQAGSPDFVQQLNKDIINVAEDGQLDYRKLKMWELRDGQAALSATFASIELLPKYAPEWILSERKMCTRWGARTTGAEVSYTEDGLEMKPTGRDPITSISLAENEQFPAEQYPYAAVKMKVTSKIDNGCFFFGTDLFPGPAGPDISSFDVIGDGMWHDYIVDMSAFEHGRWKGTVNTFRLDPINDEDRSAVIVIERIGLFKTLQEAQNFLDQSPKVSSVISDSIQKVYLSGSAGQTKGDRSAFMLKSNAPNNQKPNERAQLVVQYTDNGGNVVGVPMCYTDQNGFTTFTAAKPGNYYLTYVYKKYSDVSGHWGEDYIDFVSARGLFGGTGPDEFSPEQTMTRGMFITVLGRMHGVESVEYDGTSSGFDDVSSSEYYAPYVQWAAKNGIVSTLQDRNFYPDSPISRIDMAQMIYRYISKYSYVLERTSDTMAFSDISSLSAEQQLAVQAIQRCGIINGKENGLFDPNGMSTRAEVSAVMSRLIKAVLHLQP